MKRILTAVISLLLLTAMIIPLLITPVSAANTVDLFVSVNGSGTKDGSSLANATTLDKIKDIVNQKKAGKDVVVHLADGDYHITEPLTFTGVDSADTNHTITYLGSGNTHINGAKEISGWKSAGTNMWSVSLPDVKDVEGLYIDGVRMHYATGKIKAKISHEAGGKGSLSDILFVWTSSDEVLKDIVGKKDAWLELVKEKRWWHHTMPIENVTQNGNSYRIEVTPRTSLAIKKAVNSNVYKDTSTFAVVSDGYIEYILANAKAVLDEEGEYYFDKDAHVLYYYSATSPVGKKALLPQSDQLLVLKGSQDNFVYGLSFENISFEYGTTFFWHYNPFINTACDTGTIAELDEKGKMLCSPNSDQYPCEVVRIHAVEMTYSTHITFKNNDLLHCYTSGIYLGKYTYNIYLEANHIADLAGNGISVNDPVSGGDYWHELPEDYETLRSIDGFFENQYNDWEGKTWMPINIHIKNNYIHHVGLDYWTSVGISATGRKIYIEHNTVSHTAFTSIGAGGCGSANAKAAWVSHQAGEVYVTENYMEYMMECLADSAAIHTSGTVGEGGCFIERNYINHNMEAGQSSQWIPGVALYLDTGSDNYTLRNNLVTNCKNWLKIIDLRVVSAEYGVQMNNTITGNYYGFKPKHNKGLEDGASLPGTNNVLEDNHELHDWYNYDEPRAIAENAGVQVPVGTTGAQASVILPDKEIPPKGTPETQAPETKAPETKAPETKAPETKAPETKAPETKAPETKAPETKAPETKAPETKAPETKAPETKAPETKAPETKAPETKAPETVLETEQETKEPETALETDPVTEPETEPETQVPETEKQSETKAPETKAPETNENGGLPVGAIIGIIAGVVIIGGGVTFFLVKKKK